MLKEAEVELELLTDIDILLMVEKRIVGGICHAMYRYAANKYMKNYDRDKESFYIFRCKQSIWMGNVSKITCKWL